MVTHKLYNYLDGVVIYKNDIFFKFDKLEI